MRLLHLVSTGFALATLAGPGASVAAAQYFESFFESYPSYPSGGSGYGGYGGGDRPLSVIIRPRRPDVPGVSASRPVNVGAPVPAVSDAKPKPFVRVDPDKVPDWHLRDDTLRWGDILMLKNGPVVFEGAPGATHRPEAFVSLDRTRTLSRAGRHEIRTMASGIYSPP